MQLLGWLLLGLILLVAVWPQGLFLIGGIVLLGIVLLAAALWVDHRNRPKGPTKSKVRARPGPERQDPDRGAPELTEEQMEDLLSLYPDELLGDKLTLLHRQLRIDDCRLDLLFRKGPGRLIAVEVKRAPAKREIIGQVLQYCDVLEKAYPNEWARVMLVAPSIDPRVKTVLRNRGVLCREISLERFLDIGFRRGHF